MEEERPELVNADEEKKISEELKSTVNEAVVNQLLALYKSMKSQYELSSDERNTYLRNLKYYPNIISMNTDLISLALVFFSKYIFNKNMSLSEKRDLELFMDEKVIPFMLKEKSDNEAKKNGIRENFISYLISLSDFLSPSSGTT